VCKLDSYPENDIDIPESYLVLLFLLASAPYFNTIYGQLMDSWMTSGFDFVPPHHPADV